MFSDNQFKKRQISSIAEKSKSGSSVTVYRVGDHIDISSGPLISQTSQIGRYSVCAVSTVCFYAYFVRMVRNRQKPPRQEMDGRVDRNLKSPYMKQTAELYLHPQKLRGT